MPKYSYSTDQENYSGQFDTISAACDEAAAQVGEGRDFWVGENVEPPQPEVYFDAEWWLDHVSEQDEYSGDWASGWECSTKEQREELEREVRAVMAAWLDRHKLRPQFWNVKNAQRYFVAGKIGEVFEIEGPFPA